MTYGISGNAKRAEIWEPVVALLRWLCQQGLPYSLHDDVAAGLRARNSFRALTEVPPATPDIQLSFGGDGTLLRTAHQVAGSGIPILGINLGRVGFLAAVDATRVQEAVLQLEAGAFDVESRLALSVRAQSGSGPSWWALNDVVLARAELAGLIAITVKADGEALDTYWADGLIVATPTGSTAYSLAAGGPIVAPGTDALVVTPIASHGLTARPVVLPGNTVLVVQVAAAGQRCVLAVDGMNRSLPEGASVQIARASRGIRLVQLKGHHYFQTLRSKLSWGSGPQQRIP